MNKEFFLLFFIIIFVLYYFGWIGIGADTTTYTARESISTLDSSNLHHSSTRQVNFADDVLQRKYSKRTGRIIGADTLIDINDLYRGSVA